MQAKWEEMFGEKNEEVVEEVKAKKPRKKAVAKKPAKETKKTPAKKKTVSAKSDKAIGKAPGTKKVPVKKPADSKVTKNK